MYAHKTKVNRSIITINEWAKYLGKSRHTVKARINEYERLGFSYDSHDIFALLNFMKFLNKKKMLS